MKKQVKKYGDTLVISFSKEEQLVYDIKEGYILDLSDMAVIKKKMKPRASKYPLNSPHNRGRN